MVYKIKYFLIDVKKVEIIYISEEDLLSEIENIINDKNKILKSLTKI